MSAFQHFPQRGWRDAFRCAEAIECLLDDAESQRMGEGAYRLWQERYTPEHGLQQLEAAYTEWLP